jgi:uncharacterized protein YciI
MGIVGPFPSQEDGVTFVWLRGFPNEASREPLNASFYEGADWLGGLEAEILPMLDGYAAVVVQDTADLWSRWPIEASADRGRHLRGSTVANFALTLVHGPSWDDSLGIREQQAWTEHATFMDGLMADRFILFGGPVGDGEQTLHVVEAEDEDQIRRRVAEDPWALGGLLEVGSIRPWALWLDFRDDTPA